ncbi:MAG: DUF2099 family protein [Candidatus Methanomethylophilaceae archaeon]|nr:DUF2099 family protein [Candidatus Methanomethylophilaceae archaeon]
MAGKGGRHVYEALGMTRIVIVDGEVVSVSEPEIEYCPLFKKFCDMESISPEKVRENIEFRIRDFGFCTENRVVRAKDYVTFGVSEILSTAIDNGDLDAAVIAADGCGTAVITEPALLQGLCGRISGLVETSPLQVVLDAVGRDNVLDPETVPLDMIKGAELADSKGYRRFSVTVTRPDDAALLREKYGDRVVIVGVHTSHVTHEGAKKMFDSCDMITACASMAMRREAERREDVLVAGNKVQIYGVTDVGKRMVLDKLASIGRSPYSGEPKDEPRPLIVRRGRSSPGSALHVKCDTDAEPPYSFIKIQFNRFMRIIPVRLMINKAVSDSTVMFDDGGDLFTFHSKLRSYMIPRLTEALKDRRVSASEVSALMTINDHPGCSLNDVCLHIAADKGHTTYLVNHLLDEGLVEDRSIDGRPSTLYLTEAGKEEHDYAREALRKIDDSLTINLTERQKESLAKMMRKITDIADLGYEYRRPAPENCDCRYDVVRFMINIPDAIIQPLWTLPGTISESRSWRSSCASVCTASTSAEGPEGSAADRGGHEKP